MMHYELAMVEDCGSHWLVKGTTYNTLDNIVNHNESYLNLSHMAYKIIDKGIQDNKEVRISKTLSASEVMPVDVQIVHEGIDDIDAARNAALTKVRSLVTPEMTKESGFTLYNFIMKNNFLASKGYFITDENREEKYIEIIETGDMDLIEQLESFLESKDALERANAMHKKLEKFKKDLTKLSEIADIKQAQDDLIASVYSRAS